MSVEGIERGLLKFRQYNRFWESHGEASRFLQIADNLRLHAYIYDGPLVSFVKNTMIKQQQTNKVCCCINKGK